MSAVSIVFYAVLFFDLNSCYFYRGLSMIKKNLKGPQDLQKMPSLLGSIFRTGMYGKDMYNYNIIFDSSSANSMNMKNMNSSEANLVKINLWNKCRSHFGMGSNPEDRGKQWVSFVSLAFACIILFY